MAIAPLSKGTTSKGSTHKMSRYLLFDFFESSDHPPCVSLLQRSVSWLRPTMPLQLPQATSDQYFCLREFCCLAVCVYHALRLEHNGTPTKSRSRGSLRVRFISNASTHRSRHKNLQSCSATLPRSLALGNAVSPLDRRHR